MGAKPVKRVVCTESLARYEAPQPYRRYAQILVDPELFPDTTMCVGLFTYPPGARSHAHQHAAQNEVYFVVEGELTSVQDGRSYRVPRRGLAYVPLGVTHHAENRGRRRCVFLAVHAPTVPDLIEFKRSWNRIPGRRR